MQWEIQSLQSFTRCAVEIGLRSNSYCGILRGGCCRSLPGQRRSSGGDSLEHRGGGAFATTVSGIQTADHAEDTQSLACFLDISVKVWF